jgi:hypothetical protein
MGFRSAIRGFASGRLRFRTKARRLELELPLRPGICFRKAGTIMSYRSQVVSSWSSRMTRSSDLDLQETLERVGATVLGPSPDVARAFELIDRFHVDAAVLDNLIRGGDGRPVADLLVKRRIAFLFHTSQRQGLRKSYPFAEIIDKPSRSGELVRSLQRLLAKAQDERRGSGAAGDTQFVGRTGVEPFDSEP